MKIFKKVGSKIEQFFTWINKEPETANEGLLISAIMLGIFILFFALMSLVGGFVGS